MLLPTWPGSALDDLFSFDIASMTWTQLYATDGSARPGIRRWHGFTSAGGKLYLHGGYGFTYEVIGCSPASLFRFVFLFPMPVSYSAFYSPSFHVSVTPLVLYLPSWCLHEILVWENTLVTYMISTKFRQHPRAFNTALYPCGTCSTDNDNITGSNWYHPCNVIYQTHIYYTFFIKLSITQVHFS
jgi:hypothetical protein